MKGAWRVADVRAAESKLMALLPPGTLMQRAAAGLARRVALTLRQLGGVYGSRVVILAGPGDNGGDALYAGAMLARRGVTVYAVAAFGEPASRAGKHGGAKIHAEGAAALLAAGGRRTDTPPASCDVLLDGITGIGGRPGLPDRAVRLLDGIDATVTVAVDVPSGVGVDTGAVSGPHVTADITVTFGCRKPALVVGPAAQAAGMIDSVDIGLAPYLGDKPYIRVPTGDDIAAWWPRPRASDDKFSRGVVGVAAGSARYPGAASLAASGALAGPAGYVRYAGAAAEPVRRRFAEVVATDSVADAGRVQAWLAGPGLGTDTHALAELRAVLTAPVPVCLDADALTVLAEHPGLLAGRTDPLVLTPHDREFARLYGRPPGPDRVGDALALAGRLGCTVLLKGHHTVVADQRGAAYANPTGHPTLATAGSGDVLAGLVGALLAAGLDSTRAPVAAAFCHGLAGHDAAKSAPVTASRIAVALPGVIGRL